MGDQHPFQVVIFVKGQKSLPLSKHLQLRAFYNVKKKPNKKINVNKEKQKMSKDSPREKIYNQEHFIMSKEPNKRIKNAKNKNKQKMLNRKLKPKIII